MTVYVYTSCIANYIPKARLLAKSVKKHNPDFRFVLFMAESVPEFDPCGQHYFDEVVPVDALDIPQVKAWIFKHSVVEISTAIKGAALRHLLRRADCEAVFYVDPDIAVFAPFTHLMERFASVSILLTPHQLDPESEYEAIVDNEICSLKHGVYNLGFLGVKNSTEGLAFAAWWEGRLA